MNISKASILIETKEGSSHIFHSIDSRYFPEIITAINGGIISQRQYQLWDIIEQCDESIIYLTRISNLLTTIELPQAKLLKLGDHLSSIQTLFQRIKSYAQLRG